MKETDLMIGDYLYWGKDKIVKVQMIRKYEDNFGVDAVYNDSANLYFCTDNDDTYSYNIDELKPIPLTTDILEKNGFIKESRENHGNTLQYCILTDGLWIDISGESYFEGKLEYVHQLQHALRLCEVEKEIEIS
jgi:predicted MPP superfamily phosphohydrolase